MRLVDAVAPARLGRSFRWLVAASWTSNLGDGIGIAAFPLLVASRTSDPVAVAAAVVLQRLPWLLFGLHAGALADRVDRRRLTVGAGLVRAVVLVALAAAVAADVAATGVVVGAAFVLGVAEVVADTTAATLLPTVLARRDLPLGVARIKAGHVTLNQLVGPPLGALLFATGAVLPFLVHAATMAVSAALASRIRLSTAVERTRGRTVRRDIADGLSWLWGNAAVRTLTLTIVTFNVTFGATWAVLVLYARERLGAGEVGFGLLTTATAVGGLLGTVTYGRLTARLSLGDLMRIGLVIETFTHLALAVTTALPVALVIMFVFGAHAFVWGTTSTSVRQRAVPLELQGRVVSAYMIGVQAGIVVGGAVGGAIAGVWGVVAPMWFAFVGSGVLVVWIWPRLDDIAHDDVP